MRKTAADRRATPSHNLRRARRTPCHSGFDPVILLVVGSDGRPRQLWTNLQRDPTTSELAAVRVRAGGLDGPDVAVTPALQDAAARIAGSIAWGRPGLVWSAS